MTSLLCHHHALHSASPLPADNLLQWLCMRDSDLASAPEPLSWVPRWWRGAPGVTEVRCRWTPNWRSRSRGELLEDAGIHSKLSRSCTWVYPMMTLYCYVKTHLQWHNKVLLLLLLLQPLQLLLQTFFQPARALLGSGCSEAVIVSQPANYCCCYCYNNYYYYHNYTVFK